MTFVHLRYQASRVAFRAGQLILPAAPFAWWENGKAKHNTSFDFVASVAAWDKRLEDAGQPAHRGAAIALIYQQSTARLMAFESKAIGILQGVGIVAAVAVFSISGNAGAGIGLAIAALTYAGFASIACGLVIWPRQRYLLVLQEALSKTSGVAEMAAAVDGHALPGIEASNYTTAALADTGRALLMALLSLFLR